MAPLKDVFGVARIVAGGTVAGIPWVNVFHVEHQPASGWSSASLQDLVDSVRGFYATRFVTLLSSIVTIGDFEAFDLTSDVAPAATATGSTVGTGGSGLTSQVAQCITWRINRRYRGGHPRTYLPPPGSTSITGGTANTWSAAHRTALEAAAQGFYNDINGADYSGASGRLVAVHRYRTEVTGTPPVVLDPPLLSVIVGPAVDNRVDSQRRRLGPDR